MRIHWWEVTKTNQMLFLANWSFIATRSFIHIYTYNYGNWHTPSSRGGLMIRRLRVPLPLGATEVPWARYPPTPFLVPGAAHNSYTGGVKCSGPFRCVTMTKYSLWQNDKIKKDLWFEACISDHDVKLGFTMTTFYLNMTLTTDYYWLAETHHEVVVSKLKI